MKANMNFSALYSVLIAMALLSLFTMIVMTQIDQIVHNVLYDFGLQFSYRWAMPYWTYSAVVIGLSWFNIAASFTLIYYIFRGKKNLQDSQIGITKESSTPEQSEKKRTTEPLLYPEIPAPALIEEQICDLSIQIENYDTRHPKDIIDSQC